MKLSGIRDYLFLFAFFLFSASSVNGQSAQDDSILYKTAVNHLIYLYQQSSGDQSALYNGSQYGGYPFRFTEGYPFFFSDKDGRGDVLYDGIWYQNVLLQFDEVQEAIVMDSSSRRIQLLNERIKRFTLFNNKFIRIIRDTTNSALVRTGYYNLLYEGNTSLLKREEKLVRDDVATGELLHFIDIHRYYYIKKKDNYYSIGSKRSFFSLLKDRRKDVRQYVRKNKLSYRKDRDNMLTKATAFYDQLTK